MAVLSEILALLDRWDEWKRMRAAPDRIDELERRIAAMEAAPSGDCPKCKAANMARSGTVFRRGTAMVQKFACTGCGHREERPA